MLPWRVAACLIRVAAAHHSTAEFHYTTQAAIKGAVKAARTDDSCVGPEHTGRMIRRPAAAP